MNEKLRAGANKVKQDVRVKVAIWCSQNKELIAKKNLKELQALLADSLGVGDVPTSSLQDILKAADIPYRKNSDKVVGGKTVYLNLRSLARVLRNHMTEIGANIPEVLDKLCEGSRLNHD